MVVVVAVVNALCCSLDGLPCCMHEGAPFCTKEYAERFAPSCCVCLQGVAEAGVSIESAVLRYIDGRLKSPKGKLLLLLLFASRPVVKTFVALMPAPLVLVLQTR